GGQTGDAHTAGRLTHHRFQPGRLAATGRTPTGQLQMNTLKTRGVDGVQGGDEHRGDDLPTYHDHGPHRVARVEQRPETGEGQPGQTDRTGDGTEHGADDAADLYRGGGQQILKIHRHGHHEVEQCPEAVQCPGATDPTGEQP